jgi:hypothetical protein
MQKDQPAVALLEQLLQLVLVEEVARVVRLLQEEVPV